MAGLPPVFVERPGELELGQRASLAADEPAAVDEHVLAEARRRRIDREDLRRDDVIADVDRIRRDRRGARCLLITVTVPVNVPGLIPATFGANAKLALSRASGSSGSIGSSMSVIGVQAPPVDSVKQPESLATVTPSSPPSKKPSPSTSI